MTIRLLSTLAGVVLAVSVLGARQAPVARVERPVAASASGPHRLPVDLPLLRELQRHHRR